MAQQLLDGHIDDRDTIIAGLKAQLAEVREELRMERKKSDGIEPALKEIQRVTLPFYNILRAVHGELDSLGITNSGATVSASTSPAHDSRWDAIKSRLAPRLREAVDVLLVHGRMNTTQLAAALKTSRGNCADNIVQKLKTMGIIIKDGRDYSLKTL
jgi:hypothetical protein